MLPLLQNLFFCMKKTLYFLVSLVSFCVVTVFVACTSSAKKKTENKPQTDTAKTNLNYLDLGNYITQNAQTQLINTLQTAITQRGTHGAVTFCNTKAIPLIDSLSKVHKCEIRRVSDKYRNTQDKPKNEAEKNALSTFSDKAVKYEPLEPFTTKVDNAVYYFKPIVIGMPTCLKCHGDKEKDIDPQTLTVINQLYPNDLAKNYKMKDLRGMWVVKWQ